MSSKLVAIHLINAMADVHLPAQLPDGKNIKALALYCLFKERPDIIETYPKFAAEYERLIEPILKTSALDNVDDSISGGYGESYKTNFVCPSCNFQSRIPNGKAGVVTCPNCEVKTSIDKQGNLSVMGEVASSEKTWTQTLITLKCSSCGETSEVPDRFVMNCQVCGKTHFQK